MARPSRTTTSLTAAVLLALVCATCIFTGRSAGSDHETGVRAYGVVHMAKETVKTSFGGPQSRVADDAGAPVADLPATLALVAFLLAGAALVATAGGRRRIRLGAVSSRAPPGRSALA